MRKPVFCDCLKLAANSLFSHAGDTMGVTDLEEPEAKPLGPICSPSSQSWPKAPMYVVLSCAVPGEHLPAGTSQHMGSVSSAELEAKRDFSVYCALPPQIKDPHHYFHATSHPQALCWTSGIGKETFHTNTFLPVLSPSLVFSEILLLLQH